MASGTYLKLSNGNDAQVSKTVIWDGQVHYSDAVTLRSGLYDSTMVMFYTDVDLTEDNVLSKFKITVEEGIGDTRKSISFRMNDFRDGDTDYSEEAIFYPSFYLDRETGSYVLPIYIAARCSNGNKRIGFNDCVVTVESTELDLVVSYRTWLPPTLNQGIPSKKNPSESDPVFPSTASRVDIGVGLISDYTHNSHGYTQDYFFSNSEPMYEVTASGFMPSSLVGNSFDDLKSYLLNDITQQKTPISIVSNTKQTSTIEVLNSSKNGSFKDTFEVTKLVQSLVSTSDKNNKSTIKNRLVITGSVYNQVEPDEGYLLTQDYDRVLIGNTEDQYILL